MDSRLPAPGCTTCHDLLDRYCALTGAVLDLARRDLGRFDFLWRVAQAVLASSGADELVWWLDDPRGRLRCLARPAAGGATGLQVSLLKSEGKGEGSAAVRARLELMDALAAGRVPAGRPELLSGGGVWLPEVPVPLPSAEGLQQALGSLALQGPPGVGSLVLVPLVVHEESVGYLELRSVRRGAFARDEAELFAVQAQTIALAASNQRAHARLNERVKELHCLYELVRLANRPEGCTLDDLLQGTVRLLPPAWQHPGLAQACIELDGRVVRSPGFLEGRLRLEAPLVLRGRRRGTVSVVYRAPPGLRGPEVFLPEEEHLLQAVASEVAGIIERQEDRAERGRLQKQLRHADRLATLGQLAAGMAHELNEPLANILGFAQLAQGAEGLGDDVGADLGRIVEASLRARDIVRQLRLYARQGPEQREPTDVNALVREGSFLVASRCARQGVELVHELAPALPPVLADRVQVHQVLVNLAMNAVQAMPEGGTLTVVTGVRPDGDVLFEVRDTGCGMAPEVQEQALLPFYTTKGPEQGTGLGLAVVDGIVSAHGGTLELHSAVGQGTVVRVVLPSVAVRRADPAPQAERE